MSELELESTYKNTLDRITLPSDQIKILNWILTSKDVSNDFKREAILKFRGSCYVCNEPASYILNDTKLCGKCLDIKYPE